jgi:hypothetical protein
MLRLILAVLFTAALCLGKYGTGAIVTMGMALPPSASAHSRGYARINACTESTVTGRGVKPGVGVARSHHYGITVVASTTTHSAVASLRKNQYGAQDQKEKYSGKTCERR